MMNQSAAPLLQMRDITKRFPGVLANDHVSLELYPGEVLALLGENGAGKSTLMNVLVGLYRPDEGEIVVRGRKVEIHSPRDAAALGIGMVHQNFMLVETMTVAENIILGMPDLPFKPDMEAITARIRELSARYNLEVDPAAYIWQLSVGEQQRVEILKLIYRGAEILILDEPTAVLTPQEAEELRRVIQLMTAEGKAAIFITHKMEEVMAFSQRVMVLARGRVVAEKRTAETSPQELAQLMVGREVLFRLEKRACQPGAVVLEVRDLTAENDKGLPALRGITLQIHAGEILGIAGVAGNGQRELAEAITGLRKATGGSVHIGPHDVTNQPPLRAIQAGVSHIPEDRMGMGAVGNMAVADNLAMKGYRQSPLGTGGVLRYPRILEFARRMIETFRIATPSPQTRVKFLSGGNLQKTILAREITACGGLLVAVHPTRGLDVGATEAVRKLLLEQRDQGAAVLLISEDLEELLAISDRIAVMFEGQIMGIVPAEQATVEALGLMMAGVRS
ncbi:MAG: ABC transporter ATP-binding protein [Chloroflexi bacterium]|nr:ABC transporter ATP-binding protein [Chloroflexota bacterium]HOC22599.1 ABC transporter ATP-binding protein [Anaerolineae bacterium]HOS80453.1 ABC transporter ATP-binding protein [Anaerolineae bacterium]HQM15505.1 ABC transporter ATP-binding protein [Anaerolineae bacterium]HUM36744.1 ABC transporter ATP-binding protein [Anaerolineae bacterium]